jgi:hypothetical protein
MDRRQLITGLISLVAAPAIVRVSSIMPVRVMGPLYYSTAYRIVAITRGTAICSIEDPRVLVPHQHVLYVRPLKGVIRLGDRVFVDDNGRAYA